jgi:hypothetical protein
MLAFSIGFLGTGDLQQQRLLDPVDQLPEALLVKDQDQRARFKGQREASKPSGSHSRQRWTSQ